MLGWKEFKRNSSATKSPTAVLRGLADLGCWDTGREKGFSVEESGRGIRTIPFLLQWDFTSQLSEWPSSKNPQRIKAGEGVERREPSYTEGIVDWPSHNGGGQYGGSWKKKKKKHTHTHLKICCAFKTNLACFNLIISRNWIYSSLCSAKFLYACLVPKRICPKFWELQQWTRLALKELGETSVWADC